MHLPERNTRRRSVTTPPGWMEDYQNQTCHAECPGKNPENAYAPGGHIGRYEQIKEKARESIRDKLAKDKLDADRDNRERWERGADRPTKKHDMEL